MEYDKHWKIPFGKYVKNEPKKTNTQAPRTIDAIYLTVNLKNEVGYVVLDLEYGIPINRREVTDIPVQNLVIKSVGNMVEDNKITTLKFENKSRVLLHPNYCLAGVNYEDTNLSKSEDTKDDEQNSHKYDIEKYERVDAEERCKRIRRICRNT